MPEMTPTRLVYVGPVVTSRHLPQGWQWYCPATGEVFAQRRGSDKLSRVGLAARHGERDA